MGARGERSGEDAGAEPEVVAYRPQGRRSADEDRRRAELYENAPVGYLTLDWKGCILDCNQTAARMLGRSPSALRRVSLDMFLAAQDRDVLSTHVREVLLSRGRRTCDLTFENHPGELRFVGHLESVAAEDERGRVTCHAALSDVTERCHDQAAYLEHLRRERQLREGVEAVQRRLDRIAARGAELAESLHLDVAISRSAQLAVPFFATYCAVDLCDGNGHLTRRGFAREDGVNEDLPLDPYAPRGPMSVIRNGHPELLSSPTIGDLLGLLADPSGLRALREHVHAYLCVPLRAHGRTIGAISFARARGSFGPEDLALASEIARHAALAIDNARLYREAQEADRRKDEFLAMLGHELRNPLAAVVAAAAKLRRDAADPASLSTVAVVERQSERLARLVDDLLDISRVTRGKIALQRRPVAIRSVLARAVESTRPLLDEREHELSVVQPEAPLVVDGDPTRLEQVFVNLLANAARYTPPGGRVSVSVERIEREVVVTVRDTGIGIPREMLSHVFAPFVQIDPSPDRTDRGLGIGLTLAQQLVEAHGGRISIRSEGPGRGTELTVRLPLSDAAEVPSAREPALLAPRRRVMVVDDNQDIADLLREELASLGHDVRVANDGIEAVDEALAFLPEIMIIDLGLPGMTGYEVAERLRREPTIEGTKLVALTGYGGDETAQRCRVAGFDQHLTKPITEDTLRGLLSD